MELETLELEYETETFEELVTLRRVLRCAEHDNPDTLQRIEHGIVVYLFGPNGDR